MVKLRLKRFGRRNLAFYRVCAMDARTRRDGKAIEELGYYAPTEKDPARQFALKTDRVAYWLSVGAQPTPTVLRLIEKAGIPLPKHILRRREIIRKQRERAKAKKLAQAASASAQQTADQPPQPAQS